MEMWSCIRFRLVDVCALHSSHSHSKCIWTPSTNAHFYDFAHRKHSTTEFRFISAFYSVHLRQESIFLDRIWQIGTNGRRGVAGRRTGVRLCNAEYSQTFIPARYMCVANMQFIQNAELDWKMEMRVEEETKRLLTDVLSTIHAGQPWGADLSSDSCSKNLDSLFVDFESQLPNADI